MEDSKARAKADSYLKDHWKGKAKDVDLREAQKYFDNGGDVTVSFFSLYRSVTLINPLFPEAIVIFT